LPRPGDRETAGGRRAAGSPRTESRFVPGPRYFLAVLLSWALPGAGHWMLGHRARGALLALLVLGTFWWGEAIAAGFAVTRVEHPVFFIAQAGVGVSALAADWTAGWDPKAPPITDAHSTTIDRRITFDLAMGILLTSVSGILNLLLILHVMDPRSWQTGPDRAVPGGPRGRSPA
jgi:hypothetical protein